MSALINAHDTSASAARSAPLPRLRAVCFLREPIPASLSRADSQALGCALAFIAGALDGDEADNQERVEIGIAAPDFDPFIIVRDDGSHVISEALKTSHERGQEPS